MDHTLHVPPNGMDVRNTGVGARHLQLTTGRGLWPRQETPVTTPNRPSPSAFRQRFAAGERLVIKTPTTHAIEILGDLGFDSVMIDAEHARSTPNPLMQRDGQFGGWSGRIPAARRERVHRVIGSGIHALRRRAGT